MKLKKGITGFYNQRDKETTPAIDENLLKDRVHQITYSTGYKLANLQKPKTSSNYYKICYKQRQSDKHITVVINAHYPYFAGINPDNDWMNLQFVSLPTEIKGKLEEAGFIYLTPEFLNSLFDNKDIEELSESEIEQITYWKSKTFGEVIFNGYD
jgi:hypothetical protein